MSVVQIVISMVTVLVALFALAPFYRKWELKKVGLERDYYELLKSYANQENDQTYQKLVEVTKQRFKLEDNDQAKEIIDSELNTLKV